MWSDKTTCLLDYFLPCLHDLDANGDVYVYKEFSKETAFFLVIYFVNFDVGSTILLSHARTHDVYSIHCIPFDIK